MIEGFEYEFRVKCENMGGESEWSEISESIIPKSDQSPRAPVFREEIRDMTVKYHANATFVTKVQFHSSTPFFSRHIQWTHNSKKINKKNKLEDNKALKLVSFVPFDKVVGHPKPVVKWYRSGKEVLADGSKIKAQEFKGGYYQLVITKADENDATVYQVRATNSSGSISMTANLEVEGNNSATVHIQIVMLIKCS